MTIETVPRTDDTSSPWLPEWMWDGCKDTDPQPFPKRLLDSWVADGREVPVRVFMQAGENPLNQVGTITVTDREDHNRQVAEALRALADEFDRPVDTKALYD